MRRILLPRSVYPTTRSLPSKDCPTLTDTVLAQVALRRAGPTRTPCPRTLRTGDYWAVMRRLPRVLSHGSRVSAVSIYIVTDISADSSTSARLGTDSDGDACATLPRGCMTMSYTMQNRPLHPPRERDTQLSQCPGTLHP